MFTKALSHRQKVMRLYKRACREIEAWTKGPGPEGFFEAKYQRALMRARFDANKDEHDTRKAAILLADGCRQLWEKRHHKPYRFMDDPWGSNFDRYANRSTPDEALDNWESWPLAEREQYPYYFNTREKRKKEILEHWHKIEKAWDEEIEAIQRELPKEKPAVNTSEAKS